MDRRLKVIMLEDLPSDVELAKRELDSVLEDYSVCVVEDEKAFLEALDTWQTDLIVSDYKMPSFDGLSALRIIRERDPFMPFVILTGSMDEDTAVECMKSGADDYVIKEHIKRLGPAVISAMRKKQSEKKAKETEQELAESESRFRSLFENNHAVMLVIDPEDGAIVDANRAACGYYGWQREELLNMNMGEINTLPSEQILNKIESEWQAKRNRFEFKHHRADGSIRDVEVYAGPISIDQRELVYSLVFDISERKAAEKAKAVSEERFRLLVESAPDAIMVQTRKKFAYLNNAAVRLFGAASADELIGTSVIERIHPDYRDIVMARIRRLNQQKKPAASLYMKFLRMDGSAVDVESSGIPMRYDQEDGALVFIRDISDRVKSENEHKALQEQLNQAQKMESVGRLAGGVAHDYNNILSVIIGYTELSMDEAKPDSPLHQNLKEVLKAAHRSREVTRQLLAFARKEAIEPEVLDLNAAVNGMLKMIGRLIGEDIELIWQPSDNLWPIEIDPSQIDQIVANLCVNARDSITNVGQITITTSNVRIDEKYCAQFTYFSPGEYVTLAVRDNGCGMDPQILNKIFEPFFTTKGIGKGTGLGLSTIYGIIKQNQGFINVESEPAQGTAFTVFFPRSATTKVSEKIAPGEIDVPKGKGETVLVVEDEASILELTKIILEKLDYRVLTAESPSEALRIADAEGSHISVLITDVIMPGMNGRQLAEQLKTILPEMGCLFISGYTADAIAHSGVLESGLTFLQKPFSMEDLAIKLKTVINSEYTDS